MAASWRSADVGVEIAEYFPKLELLGSFGWTGQSRDEIGKSAAERWRYGPSLTWSFLNFGRVHQYVKAAEARADGAVARYQETVLRALEETENALAGFRAANQTEDELLAAAAAAGEAARLSQMRYDVGASDYLTLLDAERTMLDLEDQHVQAASRRATALAALTRPSPATSNRPPTWCRVAGSQFWAPGTPGRPSRQRARPAGA